MNDKEFSQELTFVLKEMCNRVGADFESIDFKKDGWFQDYTWTSEESAKFREWFSDQLFTNNKLRENLMHIPMKHRDHINKFVAMFDLNYGWKTKND